MGTEILFYVPNIIGYIRLVLFVISIVFFYNPPWFLLFYCVSAILDGFDGYFARKLNQTSLFGAWLDIVVDLISRGGLWCALYKWGYAIILVEWLTFVSTHCRGADWKIPDEEFPEICRKVMDKGFKTPLGFLAITGIHVLPVWLYIFQTQFLTSVLSFPNFAQIAIIIPLVACRLLALRVEIFFITMHIRNMLEDSKKP